MKPSTWVHVTGAALTAGALVAWYGTGCEGYTRWPNRRLAQSDAPPAPGERALLAEAGFADGPGEPVPDIESRFAFGLVPGGTDPRHLLAVATVAGGAAAASTVTIGVRLARRRRAISGEHP